MNPAIADCLQGVISPEVALCRMLLGGGNAATIGAAVAECACDDPNWRVLAGLAVSQAAALDRLAAQIAGSGSDHSRVGDVAGIAAFFDRAVAQSPEAGVALYSLGDPAILAAATAEIVSWLQAQSLLPPGAAVLDLGCGIGRVSAALAPHCRVVQGLDVSPGMVAEARRRHPGLRFEVSDGHSISPGPWNLVLLVDSMPYIHQAGLADGIVSAAMASLAPEGSLVALNLSYGRRAPDDRADAERWAARHDAALAVSLPFKVWDGAAFVLRRRAHIYSAM